MPQISGIDLAKQLIENQIYTSIVFVTAYDKFGVQAIKLAAFDYLLKPVDPDEIQRVISRYKKRKKPDNL
jgi:two-component system LytT family response regulator